MNIQAFWRAIKVKDAPSPYDTIHLKVFYPSDDAKAQNPFADTPAVKDLAPFPVIIFLNGFNCSLATYQWLAVELAERGLVVILFDWLVKANQNVFLSPGVDLSALTTETYGTIPSASALPLILEELDNLQSDGVLAGLLDLQQIILGGHSAGGRLALENAEPKFFPGVVGAFCYGAHSAAPVSVGYNPGTILPIPDSLPMLLIGGTEDGVIANNSQIYGIEQWSTPATPVIRTFREGIKQEQGDSCLVIIEGANHFAIANYTDPTLSVAQSDFVATQPESETRSLMAALIGLFIDTFIRRQLPKSQFEQLLQTHNSLIALTEFK
ncbi:MAG: dienelactone hydrolase [Cyanobacteria bacterium P01_A01_bin.83]